MSRIYFTFKTWYFVIQCNDIHIFCVSKCTNKNQLYCKWSQIVHNTSDVWVSCLQSCGNMKMQHAGQHKIFSWKQTTFQSTYFHPSFLNKFSSLYVRPLTPCHHSFLFTLKSIKTKFFKCKFVTFTCVCRLYEVVAPVHSWSLKGIVHPKKCLFFFSIQWTTEERRWFLSQSF